MPGANCLRSRGFSCLTSPRALADLRADAPALRAAPTSVLAVRGTERGGVDMTNTGQTAFELLCPAGSIVSQVSGRQDPYIQNIGPLSCTSLSTGATSATAATSGNTAGTAFTYASASYFIGFSAYWTGSWIDKVLIRSGVDQDLGIGSPIPGTGMQTGRSLCPPGSLLAGVFGKMNPTTYVITSLGPICRAVGERCFRN